MLLLLAGNCCMIFCNTVLNFWNFQVQLFLLRNFIVNHPDIQWFLLAMTGSCWFWQSWLPAGIEGSICNQIYTVLCLQKPVSTVSVTIMIENDRLSLQDLSWLGVTLIAGTSSASREPALQPGTSKELKKVISQSGRTINLVFKISDYLILWIKMERLALFKPQVRLQFLIWLTWSNLILQSLGMQDLLKVLN